MHRRAHLLSSLILLALAAGPAGAQFESLLGGITDISVQASCWNAPTALSGRRCVQGSAFGLELIWRVREFSMDGLDNVPPTEKKTGSSRTVTQSSAGGPTETKTTEMFVPVPGNDSATKFVIIELALGYSQFAGLVSDDDTYELRGTVRELPSVTVYASFDGYVPRITPYIGLRSGIIDMHNFQAVDGVQGATTTVYGASPRSFQLGALLGVALGIPAVQPRIEAGYFFRDFPSLQWSPGSAPSRFPREMSFSGWSFSAGLQISLRDMK